MPYFRNHQGQLDDVNDAFNAYITTAEVIAVPASLMIAGYARHDGYQVETALLCAEAYADSAVVDLAMKAVTRRKRPIDIPPGEPFDDTFFSGGKSPFHGRQHTSSKKPKCENKCRINPPHLIVPLRGVAPSAL